MGEIERWIAEQPWDAVQGGWKVVEQRQGQSFWVERVPGGVRVVMSGGEWVVPAC